MSLFQELPEDRLATTDETGKRIFLYPKEVKGKFTQRKQIVHSILLLILVLIPWISINGNPLVLLDVPQRRFHFFGVMFWGHDAPMLIFVLGSILFGLAFITALLGRVWCGWACPETVFCEHVFRRIERWIEGDAKARMKLDRSPMSRKKFVKKFSKWGIYTLLSLFLAHTFVAYFTGKDALIEMMSKSPTENATPFLFMSAITGLILFAFGYFREQFCIIVCPYGRLQSILMDEHSLAISYDAQRGEPRRESVPEGETQGDCVNCYQCVQSCPTGIDIRRGLQLECIACTACADACDNVMSIVKKKPGLIRYESEVGLAKEKTKWIRPRTLIYGSVFFSILIGLSLTLMNRRSVEFHILKAKGEPYQVQESGSQKTVSNYFKIETNNLSFEPYSVKSISVSDSGKKVISPMLPVTLQPGESKFIYFFVQFNHSSLKNGSSKEKVRISFYNKTNNEEHTFNEEIQLIGPF